MANLNIRHLPPKVDELRIMLANNRGSDILGLCKTFFDSNIADGQITISGYEFLRKDRCDIINKAWYGVLLYYRNSLNCKRKTELEIPLVRDYIPQFKALLGLHSLPSAKCEYRLDRLIRGRVVHRSNN